MTIPGSLFPELLSRAQCADGAGSAPAGLASTPANPLAVAAAPSAVSCPLLAAGALSAHKAPVWLRARPLSPVQGAARRVWSFRGAGVEKPLWGLEVSPHRAFPSAAVAPFLQPVRGECWWLTGLCCWDFALGRRRWSRWDLCSLSCAQGLWPMPGES